MLPTGELERSCTTEPSGSSNRRLQLGLLELCHVPPGSTDQQVLFETFEIAALADELGYSRFWLGEHHGGETAHACPEMLVGLVAQLTQRIRVGTACVLLNYYRPLKVAKSFRLLHALFPGRIDLGVGAGRVGPAVAAALADGPRADGQEQDYPERVAELVEHLRSPSVPVAPRCAGAPELWVLGSSGAGSACIAAQHGAAFSYSLFLHQSRDDAAALEPYRQQFQPGGRLESPLCNIAVAGVCGETEADVRRIRDEHKNPFIVPTVVGTPDQCRAQLEELQRRYEVDEIIFLDVATKLEDRVRTCRLLAEATKLNAAAAVGQPAIGSDCRHNSPGRECVLAS